MTDSFGVAMLAFYIIALVVAGGLAFATANRASHKWPLTHARRLHLTLSSASLTGLQAYFRTNSRLRGTALLISAAAIAVIACIVALLFGFSAAATVALVLVGAAFLCSSSWAYARLARARGSNNVVTLRVRDVINPLVLGVWIVAFALICSGLVAFGVEGALGLVEFTDRPTSLYELGFAVYAVTTSITAWVNLKRLPQTALGAEFLYRKHEIDLAVSIGLMSSMIGVVYGVSVALQYLERPLWNAVYDRIGWWDFFVKIVVVVSCLVAWLVQENRPYRVPDASLAALTD
jgi:hypothetical protein